MDAEEDVSSSSELPHDVVAKILARLPLKSVVRSRAVCRGWNEEVSSPGFLQERLESRAGAREWMLLVLGQSMFDQRVVSWVYDPASNGWDKLKLPRWVPHYTWYPCFSIEEVTTWGTLLASAGGGGGVPLSIVWRQEAGKASLQIASPVASSRSWASLPAFPGDLRVRHVRGMWVDATSRPCRFKLVAVKEVPERAFFVSQPIRTFVFDSELWSWSETTCALRVPVYGPEDFDFSEGVFVGTVLYCLTESFNLLCYDMERAAWSWLALARPRGFDIQRCNLVNVRERLFCVALGRVQGLLLQVWKVDLSRITGTGTARPAPTLSHNFMEDPGGAYNFRCSTFEVMKVVAGQDEVYIMFKLVPDILALNLRQTEATWRWLPSVPYKEESLCVSLHCLDPWLDLGSWNT